MKTSKCISRVFWLAVVFSSGSASAATCIIDQPFCLTEIEYEGVFVDPNQAAQRSHRRCLDRALEFAQWCHNTPGYTTTATYHFDDGTRRSRSYTIPRAGCTIQQRQCVNFPRFATRFNDFVDGADVSARSCFNRAKDFAHWCGNPYGAATVATFTDRDLRRRTYTYRVGR